MMNSIVFVHQSLKKNLLAFPPALPSALPPMYLLHYFLHSLLLVTTLNVTVAVSKFDAAKKSLKRTFWPRPKTSRECMSVIQV